MVTVVVKACPFCGQIPNSWDFTKLDECYVLSHHCPCKDTHLTVCTQVYSETIEDVVDIWNHRCEEGGHNDNSIRVLD